MNDKKKHKFISELKWISLVSNRFARVDTKGRSAVTSRLSTLGIAFGVMTLIVVMSVMNGFQMSFIDAILELSSYHLRIENISDNEFSQEDLNLEKQIIEFCNQNKEFVYAAPFYEAQTLMTGKNGNESPAIIRAISADTLQKDSGFKKEIRIITGEFDLSGEDSIIIGNSLARRLGVRAGQTVNLLVLSGGSDVDLISGDRNFTVKGTFSSGYSEINGSYCFINQQSAQKFFGKDAKRIIGIKTVNSQNISHAQSLLKSNFIDKNSSLVLSSWQDYNKTFFGTLKVEKNILLLLVAIIFVVVAVNIYNGMRRLVFERSREIAIMSALGANSFGIKMIFVFRGFLTGIIGALIGSFLGILISMNTDVVFNAVSKMIYFFQYVFTAIFSRENLSFVSENSSYAIYAEIPARIFTSEVILISLFGILSPLVASFAAGKNILKMTVAEVLHDE